MFLLLAIKNLFSYVLFEESIEVSNHIIGNLNVDCHNKNKNKKNC